ncbi:MAG: CPBP family intramembrane metalloprotease [Rhodovulum sp.]|nr:CPBP family intramembrane metalloprotease [Rhodovulum sp.]
MSAILTFAATRPLLFVIALAIAQPLIALPLVAAFKIAGKDIVALRLLIPAAQSVFVLAVIWLLGWQKRAGLTTDARNVHLYWYPALIAFAPVLLHGTIEIAWGWIVFYGAALVLTGISEEGFARGIAIPALMRYGKWAAVFIAAAIFSAGHFTNVFFESFGLLEWADKFLATFGFAILYGAVFLRTGNLWPLVFLHALHDFSYLTSGTAGPFLLEAIDLRLHMLLSLMNVAYGTYILAGVDIPVSAGSVPAPKGPVRNP